MKKKIIFITTLILVIGLCSCTQTKKGDSTSTSSDKEYESSFSVNNSGLNSYSFICAIELDQKIGDTAADVIVSPVEKLNGKVNAVINDYTGKTEYHYFRLFYKSDVNNSYYLVTTSPFPSLWNATYNRSKSIYDKIEAYFNDKIDLVQICKGNCFITFYEIESFEGLAITKNNINEIDLPLLILNSHVQDENEFKAFIENFIDCSSITISKGDDRFFILAH